MAVCLNCKRTLSCGCQKRKAKDGTSVCTNCIANYELKLATKVIEPTRVNTANITSPKHVSIKPQIWGPDRYIKKD